jgi:hypothetical protein
VTDVSFHVPRKVLLCILFELCVGDVSCSLTLRSHLLLEAPSGVVSPATIVQSNG